jgi:Na+-driven multidrug efflux pump
MSNISLEKVLEFRWADLSLKGTINNLFNVVLLSIGSAVGIMVGQNLGANEIEEAKKTSWRLIVLSVISCSIIGVILAVLSPYIPHIYNTETEVKQLATTFLIVIAIMMPFASLTHDTYFIIRSGGKTFITFLFDSAFMWVVGAPLAFILANYTSMHVSLVYFCVLGLDIPKSIVGYILIKKGIWITNIIK